MGTFRHNLLYTAHSSLSNLYMFGNNDYGQLGIGITSKHLQDKGISYLDTHKNVDRYRKIPSSFYHIGGHRWSDIAVGSGFTVAIDTNGILWGWGDNSSGCLGLGASVHSVPVPTRIPCDYGASVKKWRNVYAYDNYTLAIDESGYLWGCGVNYDINFVFDDNIVGDDSQTTNRLRLSDTPIPAYSYDMHCITRKETFKKVAAGGQFVAGITDKNNLRIWSNGNILHTAPNVIDVAAGDYHVVYMYTDTDGVNRVCTYGALNDYGQYGHKSGELCHYWEGELSGISRVVGIYASGNNTYIVEECTETDYDGNQYNRYKYYGIGDNTYGQVCNISECTEIRNLNCIGACGSTVSYKDNSDPILCSNGNSTIFVRNSEIKYNKDYIDNPRIKSVVIQGLISTDGYSGVYVDGESEAYQELFSIDAGVIKKIVTSKTHTAIII